MEKRIAPYIKRHLKDQEARVKTNLKNRVQRYRSSLFIRPECADLPDYVLVSMQMVTHFDPKRENEAMALNRMAVGVQGKIIILTPTTELVNQLNIDDVINTIANREWNMGVVFGTQKALGIAVSMDMFLLARGLDELIPESFDAVVDLILRLDLLGVRIKGKELLGAHRSINVDKGELLVNFGSPNFPDAHSAGN